jgi:hypothetical protein
LDEADSDDKDSGEEDFSFDVSILVQKAMDATKLDREKKEKLTKEYIEQITKVGYNKHTKFNDLLSYGLENVGITISEHADLISQVIKTFVEGNNFTMKTK